MSQGSISVVHNPVASGPNQGLFTVFSYAQEERSRDSNIQFHTTEGERGEKLRGKEKKKTCAIRVTGHGRIKRPTRQLWRKISRHHGPRARRWINSHKKHGVCEKIFRDSGKGNLLRGYSLSDEPGKGNSYIKP